jgi:hypothetical protein
MHLVWDCFSTYYMGHVPLVVCGAVEFLDTTRR